MNKVVQIKPNTPLDLECVFNGNPTPTVIWLHRNRILLPGTKYSQFQHIGKLETIASLQIHHISMDDIGEYTCFVNNTTGHDARGYINVEYSAEAQMQERLAATTGEALLPTSKLNYFTIGVFGGHFTFVMKSKASVVTT